jgi:preprotein translocase subunit SecF
MKKIAQSAITMLLFLSSNILLAQTKFNGTWKFKEHESISVNLYANGSPKQVTINQEQSKFQIVNTIADQNKDTTSTETFTDDKLDFKNTDTWTLGTDKLILDRKNENYTNGETWESKATYEKQYSPPWTISLTRRISAS